MRTAFAHTTNVVKFLGGLSALQHRGAGERQVGQARR